MILDNIRRLGGCSLPHLAQAMDDIKLGRVQPAESAFADVLDELEKLDV